MLRQAHTLVRAFGATGLVALVAFSSSVRAQGPADRVPGLDTAPATVSILQAQQDGLLSIDARGQGDQLVQLSLRNEGSARLNVVLPPGLVAAASSAQPGGGGGFQSMGLGVPTRTPGSFGAFAGQDAPAGFRSMPTDVPVPGIAVAPGETVDVTIPAVCLNFGVATPTPTDRFRLVDVADYTTDLRAQRALRGVATIGTSQKVAQAVAWHTFNGMSFPQLAGPRHRDLAARRRRCCGAGHAQRPLMERGTGLCRLPWTWDTQAVALVAAAWLAFAPRRAIGHRAFCFSTKGEEVSAVMPPFWRHPNR
jgi:hypothetical protein